MGYTKFHSYLYNCTTKGKPVANPKGTETDIVCWLRNEALQLQCASLKGTSTTVLQTLPAAPVNVLTGPVTASIAVRKVKLKAAPVAVRSRRSVSPNFPCWTRNTIRGQFDLIDLGEAPPCGVAPEHWRHPVPSVPGGYVQLRDGLRVRKHFQLGDLAGKTFDWCVVQDRSLTRQGRPLYKIWQVSQDPESGFAISKRAEVAHSPHQMWNDVFCRHTGKKNSCHDASGMCGFKEPDVVALLRLSESAQSSVGESGSVFAKIKDLDSLSDRRLSTLRRVGMDMTLRGMATICPSDPAGAFRIIQSSKEFEVAFKSIQELEELKQLPFVLGLVEKYAMLDDDSEKEALLALMSPYYSYRVIQDLFGVTEGAVERSRMFAAHEECKLFQHMG